MRISTSQIFTRSLRQMSSALGDVTELNIMNSSQKKINSPSDDPSGMGRVISLRGYDDSLSGYVDNCSVSGEYLSTADDALNQAGEVISAILENAEQGATETYTESQLQMIAEEMVSYFESMVSLSNTEMGTDSLFAGNDLESNAYEWGLGVTLTNDEMTSADFVSVTGELDSNSVYVRFSEDGTVGTNELDYTYSLDGGETWSSGTLSSSGTTLDLGTCQVELASGTAVTEADGEYGGSEFIIRRAAAYVGSDEAMTVAISEGVTVAMTSVGSDIFGGVDGSTGAAYGGSNLFEAIADCIAYLDTGNYDGVADCLETIRAGQDVLETGEASIGARENRVDSVEESLTLVREMVANSISSEEDADAAQILVELEQANYVYEAVLSTSAELMQMSLLDYL